MSKNRFHLICMNFLIVLILCTSFFNASNPIHALQEENSSKLNLEYNDFSTWRWSDLELVSSESIDDSSAPSFAIDSYDQVHVVWKDISGLGGSSEEIYYKYRRPGLGWSTTEVISTEGTGFCTLPDIAIDRDDNVHIVWQDASDVGDLGGLDYDIFYKMWNITDDTWSTTKVISEESDQNSQQPRIMIDLFQNIHVVWEDYSNYDGSGLSWDIFYKRWGPLSGWTLAEVVSQESLGFALNPSADVDMKGNVHVTWNDGTDYLGSGTDNDIFYKYWNVVSQSWTIAEVLSTESDFDSTYPVLKVDSVGNIHVSWRDISEYLWAEAGYDIFYKSFKQGTGWTNSEIVSTETTDDSHNPELAVNDLGQVFVSWTDETNFGSNGIDTDTFFKIRDPVLEGWHGFQILTKDSTSDSYSPRLKLDRYGNLHMVWFDATAFLNSDTDYDIFYNSFGALPVSPALAIINPNPTGSDEISLEWEELSDATEYHIYRSSEYIWKTKTLTPIGASDYGGYTDTLPLQGTYYYVVVAENLYGNGSISECRSIMYDVPSLSEILIPVGIILGFSTIMFAILLIKRKK
ncbi:MAG: hypothetical protein HGN29_17205 [Asgard group archaeon]|nr:hypothetical protein [Asgard group archaeon]